MWPIVCGFQIRAIWPWLSKQAHVTRWILKCTLWEHTTNSATFVASLWRTTRRWPICDSVIMWQSVIMSPPLPITLFFNFVNISTLECVRILVNPSYCCPENLSMMIVGVILFVRPWIMLVVVLVHRYRHQAFTVIGRVPNMKLTRNFCNQSFFTRPLVT